MRLYSRIFCLIKFASIAIIITVKKRGDIMKHKVLFIGDKDFFKKYTDESIYEKYDITVLKAGTSDDEVLEKCPVVHVIRDATR